MDIDKEIKLQIVRCQKLDLACKRFSSILTELEDIAIQEKEREYTLKKKKDPNHRDTNFEVTLANWQRGKY